MITYILKADNNEYNISFQDKVYTILNVRQKRIRLSLINDLIRKNIKEFKKSGDYGIYFYSSTHHKTINSILVNFNAKDKSIFVFKIANKYSAFGVDFAILEDEITLESHYQEKNKIKYANRKHIAPLRTGLRKVINNQ